MIKIIEIKWAIKILRVINQISINNLQIKLNLILINLMAQKHVLFKFIQDCINPKSIYNNAY